MEVKGLNLVKPFVCVVTTSSLPSFAVSLQTRCCFGSGWVCQAGGSGPVSKAHTRRRLAGGDLALSCCAITQDGKHAVAGTTKLSSFFPLRIIQPTNPCVFWEEG